jgi:transposase
MVAADDRRAVTFSLTPGQWGDGPAGRELLRGLPQPEEQISLIMDRAYQGNATRQLAFDLGFDPVVPPHPNRRQPWSINEQLYRRRNEIERLFRRLKAFRRIFSRYDKLDVMFSAFIHFALIAEALRPRVA